MTSCSLFSPQRRPTVFFLVPTSLRSDLTPTGFTEYFQFVHSATSRRSSYVISCSAAHILRHFTSRQLAQSTVFNSHSLALHIQKLTEVSWYLTHILRHFTSKQITQSTVFNSHSPPLNI